MRQILIVTAGLALPSASLAQESDSENKAGRLLDLLVEEWHYSNTSADTGGGAFCIRTSIQTCSDDHATVRQHYFDKFGFKSEYEPPPKKFYRYVREDEAGVYLWDDRIRGVEGRVEHDRTFFVLTTPDDSITGVMDPPEAGDPPVIQMSITVDPTTEVDVPSVDDDGANVIPDSDTCLRSQAVKTPPTRLDRRLSDQTGRCTVDEDDGALADLFQNTTPPPEDVPEAGREEQWGPVS